MSFNRYANGSLIPIQFVDCPPGEGSDNSKYSNEGIHKYEVKLCTDGEIFHFFLKDGDREFKLSLRGGLVEF